MSVEAFYLWILAIDLAVGMTIWKTITWILLLLGA